MRLAGSRWLCVVALLSSVAATDARAATLLVLSPSSANPGVGDPFDVSLVFEGTGPSSAPTVAAFDIGVAFDPSAVQLMSSSFGVGLGDSVTDLETAPGLVTLQEASLLDPASLSALQTNPLPLASFQFVRLDPTATTINFGSVLIQDELGQPIAVELVGATLGGTTNPIPEARTSLVYALGALLFAWVIRSELPS